MGKRFLAQSPRCATILAGYIACPFHADIFFRAITKAKVDNSVNRTFRSFLSPKLLILDDLRLHRLTPNQ